MARMNSARADGVERGRVVRVAIAGAGFLGRGLVNQLARRHDARVVAIADRNPGKMKAVAQGAGLGEGVGLSEDPRPLVESGADVVVDCTGDPLLGAELASAAIERQVAFLA